MKIAGFAGLWLLAVVVPGGPASAQRMMPVDCGSTGLHVPFAGPMTCEKGMPFQGTGLRNTCTYTPVVARGQDARSRFAVIGIQGDGTVCQLYDEAQTLQTATPFVRNNGRDFSGLKQFDGRIAAMTFTGSGEAGDAPCFAFQKLGPKQGAGYANRIRGYVCNRDGAAVSDAEIQQLVGTMTLQ
jgi:hypothetical protein